MNLPNKLTIFRVIMIPFFLIALLVDEIPGGKWIAVSLFIIAREFIISGFRLVASDNGVVIAASWWGKIKTVVQMIMTIVLICDFRAECNSNVITVIENILIYSALALTVISLIDYLAKNKAVLKEQK